MIKGACSSTGMSLHLALQPIQQGEISSAIVCGTNLILAPGMTITMSVQMALSDFPQKVHLSLSMPLPMDMLEERA